MQEIASAYFNLVNWYTEVTEYETLGKHELFVLKESSDCKCVIVQMGVMSL